MHYTWRWKTLSNFRCKINEKDLVPGLEMDTEEKALKKNLGFGLG